MRGPADFFVAGRKLTWPYVAATMLAANIGAGATVGATGLAYQQGVSAWFWNGSAGIGSLMLATDRRTAHLEARRRARLPHRWRLSRGSIRAKRARDHRVADLDRRAVHSRRPAAARRGGVQRRSPACRSGRVCSIGGAAMTGYFSAGGLLSSVGVSVVQLIVKFTGFAIAIPILMNAAGGFDAIAQTPALPDDLLRSAVFCRAPDPASRCCCCRARTSSCRRA